MRIRVKKLSGEACLYVMLCMVFLFNILMYTFNNCVRLLIGNTYYLDSLFMYVCYFVLALKAAPRVLKTVTETQWLMLIVLLGTILLSCENSEVLSKILSEVVPYALIAFLCGASITGCKDLWKYMYRFAWLMLAMIIVDVSFLGLLEGTSHMFGYAALFSACVLGMEVLNNKVRRIWNIVGVLFSVIYIIQSNTSGALVAFVLCMLVGCLFVVSKFGTWAIVWLTVLFGTIILLFLNYEKILILLIEHLSYLDIRLDVLNELLESGLKMDRFRSSIYEYCSSFIRNHLFLGCGIGNDRMLITLNTLVHDQVMVTNHPHNIFLEFMMQFGLIPGVMLGIIVLYVIVKYLFAEKDKYNQCVVAVLLGLGFFPLLFSTSYIENTYFYLLIGFVWGKLKKKRLTKSKKIVFKG